MSKQLARTVINGFNRRPALLSVACADVMLDSLKSFVEVQDSDEDKASLDRQLTISAAYGFPQSQQEKPFAFANGVAFIPVTGLLVNRFTRSWGWVTGYNFIRNQLNSALADDDVTLIVFDCDSGGGMVPGCFELANDIFNSRAVKPSVAVVDASCYSACYAIASSASRIVATPSAGIGSVGVVAMHVDYSQMLKDAGVKVTFIYSGDHKVDGNSYQPLPSTVRADIQKDVDITREEFVALVARNRGLDPKIVRDTEAKTYTASDARDLGLVDAVLPPTEAVAAFLIELSGSETDKEVTMSTSAATPGAESTATAPENQPAANPAASTNPVAERSAERERIKAIQSHEAAKEKPSLANHLALNTDLSVEAAAAIMVAAAPENKVADAGKSAFTVAMEASEHPNVGADAGEGATQKSLAQRILDSQAVATGVKH